MIAIDIYGDLHIHIGRTAAGKPVKISASPRLTLTNILRTAQEVKGLHLVGVVDAAACGVLADIKKLTETKELQPLAEGGYLW
ncbi:MAG: TIGR00375 family protein, partial [Firmicutes bacterium]|nr:TIGR00375 family protein [Bacillota bacterium]